MTRPDPVAGALLSRLGYVVDEVWTSRAEGPLREARESELAERCAIAERHLAQQNTVSTRLELEVSSLTEKLAERARADNAAGAAERARAEALSAARAKLEALERALGERRRLVSAVCVQLSDAIGGSGAVERSAPMLCDASYQSWPWERLEASLAQLVRRDFRAVIFTVRHAEMPPRREPGARRPTIARADRRRTRRTTGGSSGASCGRQVRSFAPRRRGTAARTSSSPPQRAWRPTCAHARRPSGARARAARRRRTRLRARVASRGAIAGCRRVGSARRRRPRRRRTGCQREKDVSHRLVFGPFFSRERGTARGDGRCGRVVHRRA